MAEMKTPEEWAEEFGFLNNQRTIEQVRAIQADARRAALEEGERLREERDNVICRTAADLMERDELREAASRLDAHYHHPDDSVWAECEEADFAALRAALEGKADG